MGVNVLNIQEVITCWSIPSIQQKHRLIPSTRLPHIYLFHLAWKNPVPLWSLLLSPQPLKLPTPRPEEVGAPRGGKHPPSFLFGGVGLSQTLNCGPQRLWTKVSCPTKEWPVSACMQEVWQRFRENREKCTFTGCIKSGNLIVKFSPNYCSGGQNAFMAKVNYAWGKKRPNVWPQKRPVDKNMALTIEENSFR